MDLEQFDVVQRCIGQTLTPQERCNIEGGMILRRAEENLHSVQFWGRICGESCDYLLVVALSYDNPFPKKFYFCTDTLSVMQQLPEAETSKIDTINSWSTRRFKGDPSLLLREDDPSVSELDRLAHVVRDIDSTIALVPSGAYIVSSSRQILRNSHFSGLEWNEAWLMDNYFHFTEPDDVDWRSKFLPTDENLVHIRAVLKTVQQDLTDSWVLAKDNTGTYVTLRCLFFPGSFVFHQPETMNFGSVYFGFGIKNYDLFYML
uniref:Radial spoke head protein 9 homolog n=1 Tax=Albugo laibachii Nc14 TaxID=890382 RepID=F0WES0_9STRA|nr:radial spoke protein putative [Albugo laibachii Nc14]|eukprot:CCA19702.1 radial spoke protein putative [Albugo laibachii Nc14]